MNFKSVSNFILSAGVAALMFANPVSADSITPAVKSDLQGAMMDYIDYNSVDGKFVYLDAMKNKVTNFYPANLHPRILKIGQYFVLCSDFKTEAGKNVDVDFLAVKIDNEMRVLQALVGRRDVIRSMMKAQMAKQG